MPDRPQSGWLDFLDWVRSPARVVQNLDRPDIAGGYLKNFIAGPLDAVVPGDLIASGVPEDERQYSAVADIATNPLTYLGLVPGVRRAVPTLAKAGYEAGYAAAPKSVQRGIDATRRTLGWDSYGTVKLPERSYQFDPKGYVAPIDPVTGKPIPAPPTALAAQDLDVQSLLQRAHGVEQTSIQSGLNDLLRLGRVTPDEDKALADVIDNLDWSSGKARAMDPTHTGRDAAGQPLAYQDLVAAAQKRLRTWISQNPDAKVDPAKLDQLLGEHYAITDKQLKEGISRGAVGAGRAQPDYLMRVYEGLQTAGVSKPREFQKAEQVAEFLNQQGSTIGYNRNWSQRMTERAHKQGRLLKKAYLREQLTNKQLAPHLLAPEASSPAEKEAKRVYDEAMTAIGRDTDEGARLRFELEGTVPQDSVSRFLNSMNKVFKPAAVYGVGPFVRLGSIVRNQLTNYWTLAQSPEGRAYLMRDPLMGVKNLVGAFDDGVAKNLFGGRLTGGEITQSMDAVEQALKQSQGLVDNTIGALRSAGRDLEADALEQGVMAGFVLSEDLARASLQMRSQVDPRTWLVPGGGPIADIGAKMFGGLEQRMRFAYFKDLVQNQKKSAAEAAKLVNERFLDYATSSAGNRQLRTLFPFAQFIVKTVPQQAKFFAGAPAALPALAAMYGGGDEQGLPGWAREQAHVGNVLPGFAPTDVMNMIPDVTASGSFEDFQRTTAKTLGALHPVLGTGIGLASGVDTFTGKPYLEDARLPGRDPRTTERNAADTLWGIGEDIGLLQPLAGPAQQARSLANAPSTGAAATRYLTGVNTIASDPLRAEADRLRSTAEADPRVRSFQRMYTRSEDPELLQALKRLEEVRKELAAKAQAAQAQAAQAGAPPL